MSQSQFRHYWFTNQTSQISLQSGKDFNGFFWYQLRQLRAAYSLQPRHFGQDTSNVLRPVVARNQELFAMLHSLKWNKLRRFNHVGVGLVFKVHLGLFIRQPQQRGGTHAEFEEVLSLHFNLNFPSDYPHDRPGMFLDRQGKSPVAFNNFQWIVPDGSDNQLCVMNNPNDWVPSQNGNLVTVIDCLVDWMADNAKSRYE